VSGDDPVADDSRDGSDSGATRDVPAVAALDSDAIETGTDALGIGVGDAPPGTYVLVYALDADANISAGALGTALFPAGAYAYVGSAFGANGLGRVDRHRRVADGAHDVRHWHVDYLGGHPASSLRAVVAAPHADVECRVATALLDAAATDEPPLSGFGASDCACAAHLVRADDVERLRALAVDVFGDVSDRDVFER
jgi:Uri superfamily endonuclease